MAITFSINDGIGEFTTVGGVVFHEGLAVLNAGLGQIINTPPPHRLLFDLRLSTENRSVDQLKSIAMDIATKLPKARIALLVDQDFFFGISRIFAAFAENNSLTAGVFREHSKAIRWLTFDQESLEN